MGSSSGHLTTALTVVHPYLRWGDRDTSVWALAGIGQGTVENVRMLTGRRGTSQWAWAWAWWRVAVAWRRRAQG